MMRKIFGAKSITHLIYGLLMLMPFVAIGVKCAYAVVNKNAYESYSNFNKDNNEYELLDNWNQLVQGRTYRFSGNDTFTSLTNTTSQRFNVSNVQMIASSQTSSMVLDIETNCNGFGMWRDTSLGHNYIRFYNDSSYITTGGFNSYSYVFTFTFEGYYGMTTSNDLSYYTGNMITQSTINNNTNTLDNVFYYAIDEVIEENNIGLLDFTSWFDGWILSDNAMNNRFIGFANWYMNFAFLVSACYVLFLCMLWFVNFARRLLDRGMNYDF